MPRDVETKRGEKTRTLRRWLGHTVRPTKLDSDSYFLNMISSLSSTFVARHHGPTQFIRRSAENVTKV